MRALKLKAAVIGSTLIVACAAAAAADDIGKREYNNNCAACHGTTGKGDGAYAGIINTAIPDITALQKNNNGVFPYDRVYEVIDGRAELKGHGSRDMPIWGSEYSEKAAEYYSDYLQPYNAEGFVRGRILALINYIYSLQK
jgi:mono/diheme cytochrome c family protein